MNALLNRPAAPDLPSLQFPPIEPWPHPIDGSLLLNDLASEFKRFLVLPQWAAETLALWTPHTYAFNLRDVTTYLGIESPEKRCGKTTLLTALSKLVNRPVVAANISSPAFFRVIEELRPTLLIDESDTFLQNDELRGILNSGYARATAFVVRVAQALRHPAAAPEDPSSPPPSRLAAFSCWCPKAMATIGRLPETLADRCILLRMQRKTALEQCQRLKNLDGSRLRRQCARFVLDHADAIAAASPAIPAGLNDRAADIWEPLFAIADIAGGPWPALSRNAALALTASAQDNSPIGSLLLDILVCSVLPEHSRIFSRDLVAWLNSRTDRPWAVLRKGKPLTELWLAQQLRPFGIRPRTLWIGAEQAKGYDISDFTDTFRRYISKTEIETLKAEINPCPTAPPPPATPPAPL